MAAIDRTAPVHLVINPQSGYGGRHLVLADFRAAMATAGLAMVEYTTRGPDDATRYVSDLPGRAAAVAVWGGDGTVHEVARGLAGSDVPILACPAGTENLLAKELRIPSEPRKLVEVLQRGRVVNCDVGLVNGDRKSVL
jgi:diacylglycerol kinase family enzyme